MYGQQVTPRKWLLQINAEVFHSQCFIRFTLVFDDDGARHGVAIVVARGSLTGEVNAEVSVWILASIIVLRAWVFKFEINIQWYAIPTGPYYVALKIPCFQYTLACVSRISLISGVAFLASITGIAFCAGRARCAGIAFVAFRANFSFVSRTGYDRE